MWAQLTSISLHAGRQEPVVLSRETQPAGKWSAPGVEGVEGVVGTTGVGTMGVEGVVGTTGVGTVGVEGVVGTTELPWP